jgi:hypothetical protein
VFTLIPLFKLDAPLLSAACAFIRNKIHILGRSSSSLRDKNRHSQKGGSKQMAYLREVTGVALAIGMLAGCGGGGGSSGGGSNVSVSTAALTTANQTVAAQDVASTALSLFDSSQLALGAVSTRESALYAEAFSHLDRLPTYMRDAISNATATGAVASQLYDCPYGGSFSGSATDSDNSATVSTGDSVSLSFNNCMTGSGTLTGSLGFHIDSLAGTYGNAPYSVGVSMTFGSLALSSTAYSASLLGSITVAGSKTGANAFTQSISTNSLSASATYGSVTRSRSLTSFTASETRTADPTYTYLSNYSLAGTLASSGFTGTQAVSFTTPTTIVRRGTDMYPYTGVLLISGASNSALRLTVISNSQVRQDLDANGDGTYESTTTVNWNTLL